LVYWLFMFNVVACTEVLFLLLILLSLSFLQKLGRFWVLINDVSLDIYDADIDDQAEI